VDQLVDDLVLLFLIPVPAPSAAAVFFITSHQPLL
jgi:hypothetical protein